jgi:hypothetical protein
MLAREKGNNKQGKNNNSEISSNQGLLTGAGHESGFKRRGFTQDSGFKRRGFTQDSGFKISGFQF